MSNPLNSVAKNLINLIKSRGKKKLIPILLFGIISVFLFNCYVQIWIINNRDSAYSDSENLDDELFPRFSNYWELSGIIIDDSLTGVGAQNWTWASQQEWCRGYGNSTHPYIIENVTIDAEGTGSGILIKNSNNIYFIIRNCTCYNSGMESSDSGIRLESTNIVTIINNNCSNNNGNGISLFNSDNNNITQNVIKTNTIYGVSLDDTNTNFNLIYNNSFIENGFNAKDNGKKKDANLWNNSIIGNYWDDYLGVDANDDNIGDSIYSEINGSAHSIDYLPIYWDAPVLSVNSPLNYTNYGKIAPEFKVAVVEGKGDKFWYKFLETGESSEYYSLSGTLTENVLGNSPLRAQSAPIIKKMAGSPSNCRP
ncbi:MAG: NosD domain-containing protein, partial [Candidatus Hodarchaeota archaeon]